MQQQCCSSGVGEKVHLSGVRSCVRGVRLFVAATKSVGVYRGVWNIARAANSSSYNTSRGRLQLLISWRVAIEDYSSSLLQLSVFVGRQQRLHAAYSPPWCSAQNKST